MGWVSKWGMPSDERRRHRIPGWVFDYSHDRFKSPGSEIQISRVRDSNPQGQRFELEIQISRVRGSSFITRFVFNLQGQRFKSPESEIRISRVRDSNLQSQRFKSPGPEIQINTQPCKHHHLHHRGKTNMYLFICLYLHRYRY